MTDLQRPRLLLATEMDAWSASTRYRALQFVPDLERRFAVTVSLPGDVRERRPGRGGQIRYFGGHAARYLHRSLSLAQEVKDHEIVFVQRGLYPLGPGAITEGVVRSSARLVLDLDDAVLAVKPALATRGSLTRWLYGPQQARRLLRRADVVVVSSAELRDSLPEAVRRVELLPTLPDVKRYPLSTQPDHGSPIRVGWAGTIGNVPYLEPLRTVFERLEREGSVTLEVVSSGGWDGPGTLRQWRVDEEATLFTRFAVGIMPLPDTPYTRAKAGFKLLQYMAAGLPVVASPVGVNAELVTRSGAGYLAREPAEWEEALRRLADDRDLRVQLGKRARAFIEKYVDELNVAHRLSDLLAGVDE